MNEVILSKENLVIKKIMEPLIPTHYAAGALDVKTKELLGLVASMVLRYDDCIKYHLGKSHELGITTEQDVWSVCRGQYCWRHHCDSAYQESSRILGRIKHKGDKLVKPGIYSVVRSVIAQVKPAAWVVFSIFQTHSNLSKWYYCFSLRM